MNDDASGLTGDVLDEIDRMRIDVTRVAIAEIGSHRRDSAQVREYTRTVMPSLPEAEVSRLSRDGSYHWCGVFALFCLHMAGVTCRPWVIGEGFVRRIRKRDGKIAYTADPQPGDIAVQTHAPYHHEVVIRKHYVSGKPWLESVGGNVPDVRRFDRPMPGAICFYDITPLILETLDIKQ